MKQFIIYEDDAKDEHFRAIDAHNWLIAHARTASLTVRGRYLIIRMLHHIHGAHKMSKALDFYYAWRL